ncbi:MAG: tetratricopeptide repeat protein [Nitrosomonadales bacterium]|nr:tetratricopeptide repeat protein [Nitrosomonadales bacterium]
MAALDLEEQEQVETLKAWWKENGKWLLLALALILGGYAAIQGWRSYQSNQALAASTLFHELTRQIESGDPRRINDAADAVTANYGGSAYAPRALLLAAQVNIQTGDPARARTQLQWVIKHADEEGLKNVARLNLAGVLLDEKNFAGAQELIEAPHPESFDGLYADLKGDVLSAQGKKEEARAAYRKALEKTDVKNTYHSLIRMKLEALGDKK